MKVGELKKRLEYYDDDLDVCRLNNCNFPIEIIEIKQEEREYLERCYDYDKLTKGKQIVVIS